MRISGTFNSHQLRSMDTEKNTSRKGFLKRAGLAVVGIFAVSSTLRSTKGSASARSVGVQSSAPASVPLTAMARVRTAKGAVARKA